MVGMSLVIIAVAGLVGIGVAALLAPRMASEQYGIVCADPRALAFLRAMGIRDLSLGLMVGIVAATADRAALAWVVLALVPVAVVDFAVVVRDSASAPVPAGPSHARLLHVGGAVGLLAAALIVLAGF